MCRHLSWRSLHTRFSEQPSSQRAEYVANIKHTEVELQAESLRVPSRPRRQCMLTFGMMSCRRCLCSCRVCANVDVEGWIHAHAEVCVDVSAVPERSLGHSPLDRWRGRQALLAVGGQLFKRTSWNGVEYLSLGSIGILRTVLLTTSPYTSMLESMQDAHGIPMLISL